MKIDDWQRVIGRKVEKYRLVWQKRAGFARLAIKHGCDIQLFASVGDDEVFDILFDANGLKATEILFRF